MISPKSVQEIIDTAKVEDVVQDFVSLKRRGANMIGLCPFHNEKTPSFTVSPSKNIYKCFGCGRGGNAVQFLMEHENLTFPEALRYLAQKYKIEIEETATSDEARQQQQLTESLYLVNQFAKEFYQQQLFDTDYGKSIGLGYFKQRGFREEIIRKFGLGFAPEKGDALTSAAIQKGYQLELMQKLGLTNSYKKDFFRNRVMFTIHNLSGKVIGFGGRIMVKNKKLPKYINSPETDIYIKSKVLYGAYFAKRAIRQQDECILVEGYTDVISLHQSGIENVVASSGTSLTVDQIRLVKRFTPNIKILYDGDFAGVKAALRGLDLVLEQDMNVKVVLLPDGEDPDSYLQSIGSTDFKKYLEEKAQDFILFKTNLLVKDAANDPIKKAEMVKDLVQSIAKIPDPIKRSVYVRECANIVGVEEQVLVNEANKIVSQKFKKKREQANTPSLPPSPKNEGNVDLPVQERATTLNKPPTTPKAMGDEFQEKDIVRILIAGGSQIYDKEENVSVAAFILSNLEDVIDDFDHAIYKRIVREYYDRLLANEQVDTKYFLHHQDQAISQLAIGLISSPFEYSENWEKKWEIVLQSQKMPEANFNKDSIQSLLRFKLRKLMRMCDQNQQKVQELSKAGAIDQVMTHLKVQQKLIQMRNDLAEELGTVILK